jgi:peptide chain release factor subunit 1
MLTDRDVQELLHFRPTPPQLHPVLSVYLNIDPAEGSAENYRLQLRTMLKNVDLPQDSEAIMRYFEHEHNWCGRSVATFSCAPQGFFKAYPLAVPVRSRVRIGEQPYVKPLADLLDSYGGYGVILVDKQGARLFYFHLGELREQEGVLGEAIRHTKRGGGSQSPGRRGGVAGLTDYNDEVTDRNMKEVVEFATKFFSDNSVRRVVIGGTDDNVALFRSQMPKAWQSLVVGSFPISMTASHTEVLERAMQIGEQAEREREARLVESIVTSAAKGKAGVVGIENTLNALREGRVQSLVIRDGYRSEGYRCKSCGYLTAQPIGSCPFCDGETEEVGDAVELAVRQVMQTGGEVEVLPQSEFFKGFDQIGAALRY